MIKTFILNYAQYDREPLHMIINAILMSKLCNNPIELVDPIIKLQKEENISTYYHSGKNNESYNMVNLDKKILINHFNKIGIKDFYEYPSGGEYFLRITDKGKALLNKKIIDRLEKHILEIGGKLEGEHSHYLPHDSNDWK